MTSYADVNYNQVLTQLLPKDITAPNGYEVIGHVAHLNLRENQFPYKYLIGKVIQDKDFKVTTVVNKTEKLSNVYRTPILELIAGEDNYETIQLEGKLKFKLDFEKVYWCSRLHAERDRVLQELTPNQVICDAFCGIGPFALRAAKEHNCRVFASDLNPECYKYLVENIALNKLSKKVTPSCADARDYIYGILTQTYATKIPTINHYYMNLPADAIEFLDVFPRWFKDHPEWLKPGVIFQESKVHVYCFVYNADQEGRLDQVVERAQKVMPGV